MKKSNLYGLDGMGWYFLPQCKVRCSDGDVTAYEAEKRYYTSEEKAWNAANKIERDMKKVVHGKGIISVEPMLGLTTFLPEGAKVV